MISGFQDMNFGVLIPLEHISPIFWYFRWYEAYTCLRKLLLNHTLRLFWGVNKVFLTSDSRDMNFGLIFWSNCYELKSAVKPSSPKSGHGYAIFSLIKIIHNILKKNLFKACCCFLIIATGYPAQNLKNRNLWIILYIKKRTARDL